jgi:hypothetical protein
MVVPAAKTLGEVSESLARPRKVEQVKTTMKVGAEITEELPCVLALEERDAEAKLDVEV